MLVKTSSIVLTNLSHWKALEIAHENHWGIAQEKQCQRDKIFLPIINEEIKNMIR